MRILIIKPSSLGDVVQALPTVNLIRRRFPDAHISWLINAELSALLKKCPVIDDRIEFQRRNSGSWLPLLRRLRRERFDLVVDLQGLLRSGLFAFATGAARRIGLCDAREGARLFHTEVVKVPRAHAVERYLLAARHLGCADGPIEFPLGLPNAPRENWIAINPSARWKTKLWGVENFRALVNRLPAERVVFTGSAVEADWINRLADGRRSVAGKTDLFELCELYRRCAVVITNDSGPMHVAAAVGTPVVALFGPTDPALTGPHGKQHVILRSGISCSPCLKPYCTHKPEFECMTLITVEQVLAAAQPFIP